MEVSTHAVGAAVVGVAVVGAAVGPTCSTPRRGHHALSRLYGHTHIAVLGVAEHFQNCIVYNLSSTTKIVVQFR